MKNSLSSKKFKLIVNLLFSFHQKGNAYSETVEVHGMSLKILLIQILLNIAGHGVLEIEKHKAHALEKLKALACPGIFLYLQSNSN